jgi:hypothetical protein
MSIPTANQDPKRTSAPTSGVRAVSTFHEGYAVLGRLPVVGREDSDALGKRNKFHQGSNLHLSHHAVAVCLHRALCCAQSAGDLLVSFTASDKFKDLPLARR